MFKGDQKPDVDDLLRETIGELLQLAENEAAASTRGYYVVLNGVRADAPARAMLKCITSHNGYNSCERCETHGMQVSDAIINSNEREKIRVEKAKAANAAKLKSSIMRRKKVHPRSRKKPKSSPAAVSPSSAPTTSAAAVQPPPPVPSTSAAASSDTSLPTAAPGQPAAGDQPAEKKKRGVVFPELGAPGRIMSKWKTTYASNKRDCPGSVSAFIKSSKNP